MPHKVNRDGWQPPKNLREGQRDAYQLSLEKDRTELNCEWPTGYGKTIGICLSYAARASMGLIDKLLIIVPGTERKSSYLAEIEQDFIKIGFPVNGATEALSLFAGRYLCDVYVVNNESVLSNESELLNLMSGGGRWMVALDEAHHLRVGSKRGDSIARLTEKCDFLISVTATPRRTDKKPTITGGTLHSSVSYGDALKEDAIRPIRIHAHDYEVDISFDDGSDEKEVERVRLSEYEARLQEIKEQKGKELSEAQFRARVRHHSKYVQKILLDCYSTWLHKESLFPGQHQIIIYAMDCSHAEDLAKTFNDLAGEKIAEWIGSGPNGRSEKINAGILDRFLGRGQFSSNDPPDLKCLVQVLKASEGFNCIRASVMAFLNAMGESVQAEQSIGRAVRRNYKIEPVHPGTIANDDYADIFVSVDSPLLPLLVSLGNATTDDLINDSVGTGSRQTVLFPIPPFYIVDANWLSTEQFWLGNTGERISVQSALSKARKHPGAENKSDDELIEYLTNIFGSKPKQQSFEDTRDQAKKELKKAVGQLAATVVKSRSNGTFAKSLMGDTIKAINSKLKREFVFGRDGLTLSEIKIQYEWIREINEQIVSAKQEDKTQAIPSWLKI